MIINRLDAFMGKPIKLPSGIHIQSPTIKQILDLGEGNYYVNLILSSFNKEKILLDLYGLNNDSFLEIAEQDDFEVLTAHPQIRKHLCDALSFFCTDKVYFDSGAFLVGSEVLCNQEDYKLIARMIQQLNGSDKPEEKTLKSRNERTKKMLSRLNQLRKRNQKNDEDSLELKDILSILCCAEGNGIHIFNVQDLTVYQVYEQFERLSARESHLRLLPVWANGHMREDQKLPEWIKKTKL